LVSEVFLSCYCCRSHFSRLGGCSNLEFGIIIKDAIENLEHRALHVKRVICGEMMTSFNMKGFSLSVVKLTVDMSSTILNLLDAPTDAFAWPKAISATQLPTSIQTLSDTLEFNEEFTAQLAIKYFSRTKKQTRI
jgi:hypothetical protein